MAEDRRCLSVFLAALPFVLIAVGTVVFFVGFYYGDISEADTANGVLLVVGIVMTLCGFAVCCVRNITPSTPSTTAPQVAAKQLLPPMPS